MTAEVVQTIIERARQDAAFRRQLRVAPLAVLRDYTLTDDERRQFVLLNFSWLIDGRLAGMARPRAAETFAELHTVGVRALVSLTEEPLPAEVLARHRLRAEHLPVPDFAAPSPTQVERAVAAIDGFLGGGLPVAVHCAAGQGRTGTILACYLVSQGAAAKTAIATVRASRPGSIETPEQEAVIVRFERRLRG